MSRLGRHIAKPWLEHASASFASFLGKQTVRLRDEEVDVGGHPVGARAREVDLVGVV